LPERALRAHPEASSDAREYVQGRLAKILPPRRLAEAQLLASEVVTNAVRHARLNPDDSDIIRFNIEVHPGTVRFSVVDAGEGFDTASVLRKVPSNGRGLGLYLVEKLSNRWGNAHRTLTRSGSRSSARAGMAGRTNPPNGAIYRVVNLGTATIVENGIGDEDKARERLTRELGRVPGGRFAVEVRTSPNEGWLVVGAVGGFAR